MPVYLHCEDEMIPRFNCCPVLPAPRASVSSAPIAPIASRNLSDGLLAHKVGPSRFPALGILLKSETLVAVGKNVTICSGQWQLHIQSQTLAAVADWIAQHLFAISDDPRTG